VVVHLQGSERTLSLSVSNLRKPPGVETREKEGRTSLTRLELSSPSFLLRGQLLPLSFSDRTRVLRLNEGGDGLWIINTSSSLTDSWILTPIS
jgi:hypothetical protein